MEKILLSLAIPAVNVPEVKVPALINGSDNVIPTIIINQPTIGANMPINGINIPVDLPVGNGNVSSLIPNFTMPEFSLQNIDNPLAKIGATLVNSIGSLIAGLENTLNKMISDLVNSITEQVLQNLLAKIIPLISAVIIGILVVAAFFIIKSLIGFIISTVGKTRGTGRL